MLINWLSKRMNQPYWRNVRPVHWYVCRCCIVSMYPGEVKSWVPLGALLLILALVIWKIYQGKVF